jgi:NifU-like protein involved in Fe-S cluster formation
VAIDRERREGDPGSILRNRERRRSGRRRITAFAQEVRACALGRAFAAVLGAHVIGCSRAEICAARDQLRAMLAADGALPEPPFEQLAALRPARVHESRHASILLPFEATLAALDGIPARYRRA